MGGFGGNSAGPSFTQTISEFHKQHDGGTGVLARQPKFYSHTTGEDARPSIEPLVSRFPLGHIPLLAVHVPLVHCQ